MQLVYLVITSTTVTSSLTTNLLPMIEVFNDELSLDYNN